MGPKRKAAGGAARRSTRAKKLKEDVEIETSETIEKETETVASKPTEEVQLEDDGKLHKLRLLVPLGVYRHWQDNKTQVDGVEAGSIVDAAVEVVISISGSKTHIGSIVSQFLDSSGTKCLNILVADQADVRSDTTTVLQLGVSVTLSALPMSTDKLVSVQGPDFKAGLDFVLDKFCSAESPVPYTPQAVIGQYGKPETFRRQAASIEALKALELAAEQEKQVQAAATAPTSNQAEGDTVPTSKMASKPSSSSHSGAKPGVPLLANERDYQHALQLVTPGPSSQTIQLYIPPEAVGSIIGRGGQTINEMKHSSGAFIRFEDANTAAASNNKLLTISGTPESIKRGIALVFQKVEAAVR